MPVTLYADDTSSRNPLPYRSADARNLRKLLPSELAIPATLYPLEELRGKWARLDTDAELQKEAQAARAQAAKYLKIPDEQWIVMIPDRSTAPRYGKGGSDALCPLSGVTGSFSRFSDERKLDLETSPFVLGSRFSDELIYERPEDVPDGHPQKHSDGYDEIPHWDGAMRRLAYAYCANMKEPVKYYPANIVWLVRLEKIINEAVPSLTRAYLATGDDRYASRLILILKRFAEIMPGLPLGEQNGIAKVSREQFLVLPRPKIFGPPPWHWASGYAHTRLATRRMTIPGEAAAAGRLARAFMAVEESPAWGLGDEAASGKDEIRKNLFGELALELQCGGLQMGNHAAGGPSEGLLALGIVLRDRYFFDCFNSFLEDWLYNQFYYDGISTEGSVMYSRMMQSIHPPWQNLRGVYEPDYLKKHPFLGVVGKTNERIRTLYGKHSEHGDGFDGVFGAIGAARSGRDASGNALREPSAVWPGFGVGMLRAGGVGRRCEVAMTFDRVTGHGHDDNLGLQLFYQGIPILNHLGYCVVDRSLSLDPDKNKNAQFFLDLKYPRKIIPREQLELRWKGGYHYELNTTPYTKNTVAVDETGHGWCVNPVRPNDSFGNLLFYKGACDPDGAAAIFQVMEADMQNMLPGHVRGLRAYRRSILTIARPDGRPYALDVFYVDGGRRHVLLWHSVGDKIDSTIPVEERTFKTFEDWLDESWMSIGVTEKRADWIPRERRAYGERQIDNVRVANNLPPYWRHTWRLDYASWAPKTDCDLKQQNRTWLAEMRPVFLRVHGLTMPQGASNFGLRATSHYPATIRELVEGVNMWGTVVFRDGLDYAGVVRAAPGNRELSSLFVHVLEPWSEGETNAVRSVGILKAKAGAPPVPSDAGAVEVIFSDGSRDVITVGGSSNVPMQFEKGVRVEGRFALLRYDTDGQVRAARLVGGKSLASDDRLLLKSPGNYTGTVVRLEGELAGRRDKASLVLAPDGRWPIGERLSGRHMHVAYRPNRVETYVLDRIGESPDGRLRAYLKDAPTFVDFWGEVYETGVSGGNAFFGTITTKGSYFQSPYLVGSRLAFPELGVEFTLGAGYFRGFQFCEYVVGEKVDLAEIGIRNGMRFAIFPDYRGARVLIASEAGMDRDKDGIQSEFGDTVPF